MDISNHSHTKGKEMRKRFEVSTPKGIMRIEALVVDYPLDGKAHASLSRYDGDWEVKNTIRGAEFATREEAESAANELYDRARKQFKDKGMDIVEVEV